MARSSVPETTKQRWTLRAMVTPRFVHHHDRQLQTDRHHQHRRIEVDAAEESLSHADCGAFRTPVCE